MVDEVLTEIKEMRKEIDFLIQGNQKEFPQESEPYLTAKQICQFLNISVNNLRKLRKDGLPTIVLGGHIRGKISEIEKWIKEQQSVN